MGTPVASASLELTANEVKLVKALDKADKRLNRYKKSTRSKLKATSRSFNAFKAAAVGALSALAVKEIAQAGIAMQGLERAFAAATGSAAAGRKEFNFVREEANRLGLDIETSAKAFAKLSAAAKGTSLEGEQAREIFTAVSEASRVLSLSADDTAGAFRAIEQVISKGKVQAEELRGQLGERLPGAFQMAARAMGVTTRELDKMLELGKVTAQDLLPSLARELRKTFGSEVENAANDAQAAYNRFGNAMFELKNTIAESGVLDAITTLATKTANVLKQVGPILGQFGLGDEANILAGDIRKVTREVENYQEKIVDLQADLVDEKDEWWPDDDDLADLNSEIERYQDLLLGSQNLLRVLKAEQATLGDSSIDRGAGGGAGGGAASAPAFDRDAELALMQSQSEAKLAILQGEAAAELAIKSQLLSDIEAGRATSDETLLAMAQAAAAEKVNAEYAAEMEAREALGLSLTPQEELEDKKKWMQQYGDETNAILRDTINEKVRMEAEAAKKSIDLAKDEAEKKKKFQNTMLGGAKMFIGKNKALMAAARALENRERIKEAWASTYAGMNKALEWGFPLGPVFAGIIGALGAANIASMAGLGLGGGGSGGGGISSAPGGSSGGVSSSPISGTDEIEQRQSQSSVQVHIAGNLHADEDYLWNKVIPGIQEAVKERDVVFIDADTRQAEELALA